VKVLYDEGLANHIGPEPCGGLREEADEKSVGGHVGGVLRRESCSLNLSQFVEDQNDPAIEQNHPS
jgi:hypothetical protein